MNRNEEGKTSPETNILPLRDTTRIIDNPGRPAALQIRKVQTGRVQNYALIMGAAVVLVVLVFVL